MPRKEQKYTYEFRIQSAKAIEMQDEPDKAGLQSDVFAILGIKEENKEETD